MYKVTTTGVCAREIIFSIEEGVVEHVEFVGGCPGNAIGLSNMIKGSPVTEVIEKLIDVKCGGKNTSCPSQLARALQECL